MSAHLMQASSKCAAIATLRWQANLGKLLEPRLNGGFWAGQHGPGSETSAAAENSKPQTMTRQDVEIPLQNITRRVRSEVALDCNVRCRRKQASSAHAWCFYSAALKLLQWINRLSTPQYWTGLLPARAQNVSWSTLGQVTTTCLSPCSGQCLNSHSPIVSNPVRTHQFALSAHLAPELGTPCCTPKSTDAMPRNAPASPRRVHVEFPP